MFLPLENIIVPFYLPNKQTRGFVFGVKIMVFYGETAELEIYQFELQTNENTKILKKKIIILCWLAGCVLK